MVGKMKADIVTLCDDFIAFWQQFKQEVDQFDTIEEADIVLLWYDYFEKNSYIVTELACVKNYIDTVKENLYNTGKLNFKQ